MRFWKNHMVLRSILMAVFFVTGLVLTLAGWSMTGQLSGLILMLVGVVFLLTTLMLYNKVYK